MEADKQRGEHSRRPPAPSGHKKLTGETSRENPEIDERISEDFPRFIVGVGASAGGIEALLEFLKQIPQDNHLAYVIVQHMSPDFKTMLPEILTRQTGHRVTVACEGMSVEKGGIYLIPPNKMITIFNGRLLLEERDESKPTSFYPIDHFFKSLADEMGSRAIGVILSGTGSDGTKGVKALKAKSGYVIVLSPDTAKFSGMPKNAICSNAANAILPLEDIPSHIEEYACGIQSVSTRPQVVLPPSKSTALDRAFLHLRNQYGIDFSSYQEDLIVRRMERRTKIVGCESLDDYCEYLGQNIKELRSLYDDLLLGVTEFNRHPESLERLRELAFPEILKEHKNKDTIRVWAVGCSTGEEPFTVAFMLSDAVRKAKVSMDFKIFATDVDDKALKIASRASFPLDRIEGLSEDWRKRYFRIKDGQAYIKSGVRERVVFANHNVIKDAPFPSIDLITCRNLLIYLKKDAKRHIHQAFQFSLRNKGFLLLGPNEALLNGNEDFKVLDDKAKLFRCINSGRSYTKDDVIVPSFKSSQKVDAVPTKPSKREIEEDYESKLHIKLAREHLPAAIVFSEGGTIDYFFGNIRDYLAPIVGKASILLSDALPDELEDVVMALVEKLEKEGGRSSDTIVLASEKKSSRILDVDVIDLQLEKEGSKQFLAKFKTKQVNATEAELKTAIPGALQAKLARVEAENRKLKRELVDSKSETATIVGQLEASNEELRTTNEELQAGSEELQSTNEELQAVNEELYTVNAECQMRITELSEMSSDVQNIYEVSEIGTLFVDKELRIRKFNAYSQKLFNLLPDDIGRPIENFSSILKVDFAKQAKSVIKTVRTFEKEVRSKDGVTYLMRVAPYRTDDLQVKGAVLAFIDISALKRAQSKLTHTSDELQMVSQETSDLIVRFDPKGKLLYVNESFCKYFSERGFDAAKARNFADFVHPDFRLETAKRLSLLRRNKMKEDNFEFKHVTEDGGTIDVTWHTKARFDQRGSLKQFVSIGRVAN